MKRRRNSFGSVADDESLTPRNKLSEMELDITPMIDVTFLLLIFFMVTSTMQGAPDVDVPVAEYGVGVPSLDATIISIKSPSSPGASPVIVLGDGDGAEGSLDDVRAFVEEAARENRTQVIIKADRDTPHGFVQKVARAVTSVDGVEFFIGVQDRRSN